MVNEIKVKVVMTVILLIAVSTITILALPNSAENKRTDDGLLIDFGSYNGVWASMDTGGRDVVSVLNDACSSKEYIKPTFDENGKIESVNGIYSDEKNKWGFWTAPKGTADWKLYTDDPSNLILSKDSFVACARTYEGTVPLPCVDYSGNSIFYGSAKKIVTMAPSVTEMTASVGCASAIVGTDLYSNYPQSIIDGKASGKIKVTGGYTNPNLEAIVSLRPDLVIGEAGSGTHNEIVKKMRQMGTNALILYPADSFSSICLNVWIVGQATGFTEGAVTTINALVHEADTLGNMVSDTVSKRVMIALGTEQAAYTSGKYTYASDSMKKVNGSNIFDYVKTSWFASSAEKVRDLDPEVIIIVSSVPVRTQADYDEQMGLLAKDNPQWANTTAYKTGKIFFFSDSVADVLSRPGPRVVQTMELIALAIHPDSFSESLPKFVGDDYRKYLTVSPGW